MPPTVTPFLCISPRTGLLLALLGAALAGCTGSTETALGPAEQCDNQEDDDGDGKIDCMDPDCAAHLACDPEYTELQCDNGLDDDNDQLVDCEDPDCASQQACNPNRELVCNDGVDDDGDGLIDCLDPDCAQAGNCQEHCSDGLDNDGDGLIDCLDPDCATATICLTERCGNGLDDDGDLLVDCADPDCAEAVNCLTAPPLEHCDNGVDDDGDGKIDCIDPDCRTNPLCVEIFCNDGLDNDGNNAVDCEDAACLADPFCQTNTTCQGAVPIYCDSLIEGTTRGRVSSFSTEACLERTSLLGGERFFKFTNVYGITVALNLTIEPAFGGNTSFVLLLFSGSSTGCLLGGSCLAPEAKTDLTATVFVAAGQTIYAAVDSVESEGGDFLLQVTCPEARIELCANGIDDDEDGIIDCWDPDCLGMPGCTFWLSAGIGCNPSNPTQPCAPGEECRTLSFPGINSSLGICTRSCSHPDMPGPDCYNPHFTFGACLSSQQSTCVMQCGSQNGGTACPMGTICTSKVNGSVSNVVDGVCAPSP